MAKTSPSQEVIEELEAELERKIKERESILDELSLLDIQIDKYDVLIKEIDKEALSAISFLNNAIYDVKSSYDARISAGVKSNLVWQLDSTVNLGYGPGYSSIQTYTVVENTATQVTKNLYGLKYYQNPANRDYGSNFIADFNGYISVGSSILAILPGTPVENNLTAYTDSELPEDELTIKIGDTVTDDLDSPTIFNSTDLPTIVGFGTTEVIGILTSVVGGISTGSNIFVHFGAGDFSMVEIGQYLLAPKVVGFPTVFDDSPLPPKIVGFGTTSIELEYYNSVGVLTSNPFTSNTFILDKLAINGLEEGTFQIGILTESKAYYLSTVSIASTEFESFSAYRFDEDIDANFDDDKDPTNPVTIGLIDQSNLGVGSKLVYDAGGTESGPKKYDKYEYDKKGKKKQEPDIGPGSVTWNVGTDQYPIIGGFFGIGGSYASEGDSIKIDTSSPSYVTPSYTSTPPPGTPSGSSYNSAINSANSALSGAESGDYSTTAINAVLASSGLRTERDEKEIYAWSLLQASATVRTRIKEIETTLNSLKNTDYSKYEK